MVIFRFLHPVALIYFLSLPLVIKNVHIFRDAQIKEKTFITSIKNFIIINSCYGISILAAILVNAFI